MTASSTPPTRKSPWYGGDIGFVVIVLALAATCITGKVLDHRLEVEMVRAGPRQNKSSHGTV